MHSLPYINLQKSYRKETHSSDTTGCKMDINQLLFAVLSLRNTDPSDFILRQELSTSTLQGKIIEQNF